MAITYDGIVPRIHAMSEPTFSPDTTLGTYVLLEQLGQGGMGVVWRARNTITDKVCALKVLRDDVDATADTLARFRREVRLAATVEHPNVVRVFDPFLADDRLVLPMELVDGVSLQQHLRSDGRTPARLSVQEAVDLMLPLCAGVAAIHAKGIVHRDLKPANVMLARGPDGSIVPKIMDFGIAKPIAHDGDSTDITREGISAGSVRYMAPEQAIDPRGIDARADLYALGVIAYELLTGSRPIEEASQNLAFVALVANAPFPSPSARVPELPGAVDAVVMKALARDRTDRFRDVDEFARALKAAGASVTDRTGLLREVGFVSVNPPPPAPDGHTLGGIMVAAPPRRPSRLPWAILAASVAFTGAVIAWVTARTSAAPRPTAPVAAAIAAPAAPAPPAVPPSLMMAQVAVGQPRVALPPPTTPAPETPRQVPRRAHSHRGDSSRGRASPGHPSSQPACHPGPGVFCGP